MKMYRFSVHLLYYDWQNVTKYKSLEKISKKLTSSLKFFELKLPTKKIPFTPRVV